MLEKLASSSWRLRPILRDCCMIGSRATTTSGTAINVIKVICQSIVIIITNAPKNCSREVTALGKVLASGFLT